MLKCLGLHDVILDRDEHVGIIPQRFRDFAVIVIQTKPVLLADAPIVILIMIKWAVIFLVIALVAGVLGFAGIAGAAASIAKFLFFLFIGICVVLFIVGIFLGKKLTK